MSVFAWCTRRAGGLAAVALVSLSIWVIWKETSASRHRYDYHPPDSVNAPSLVAAVGSGYSAVIFAYYCLFIHALVFTFPMRSCYAILDLTKNIKRAAKSKSLRDARVADQRRGSCTSLSSAETLTSACSAASSEAGDLEAQPYTDCPGGESYTVVHAIIIPNYKEEEDTLTETLEVLASHSQARATYDVSPDLDGRVFEHGLRKRCFLAEVLLLTVRDAGLPRHGDARAQRRGQSGTSCRGIRQKVPQHRVHCPSFGYPWRSSRKGQQHGLGRPKGQSKVFVG